MEYFPAQCRTACLKEIQGSLLQASRRTAPRQCTAEGYQKRRLQGLVPPKNAIWVLWLMAEAPLQQMLRARVWGEEGASPDLFGGRARNGRANSGAQDLEEDAGTNGLPAADHTHSSTKSAPLVRWWRVFVYDSSFLLRIVFRCSHPDCRLRLSLAHRSLPMICDLSHQTVDTASAIRSCSARASSACRWLSACIARTCRSNSSKAALRLFRTTTLRRCCFRLSRR